MLYARLCSATGWSWEYVGENMTLPRFYAFMDYWREAPPVAESVAAFIGIKGATPAAKLIEAEPSVEMANYLAQLPVQKAILPA